MISKDAKYWIWLSQTLGYSNKKAKGLMELYPDIEQFARSGEDEWRYCGILSKAEIEKLKRLDFSVAERILSRCSELGYSVLSITDPSYPKCLLDIFDPPAVLYINGRLPDIDDQLTIAIVGTRTASRYGIENSFKFGYSLSKFGVCIISGGALGVDCASHRGVLSAKGTTVCVLGCGINYPYLMDNAGMRKAIAINGAVVSEYPPDTPPKSYHFPARNRLIAAMSDGVVIMESGEKSGSLITADFALDMGKELFALLGNNDPRNEGSNRRIKEGSAVPVTDFMDVLVEFEGLYITGGDSDIDSISFADIEAVPTKEKKHSAGSKSARKEEANGSTDGGKGRSKPLKSMKAAAKRKKSGPDNAGDNEKSETEHKKAIGLTGDQKSIYELLTAEPVHIDKIADELELPVFKVLTALTLLEMQGLAKAHPGRMYSLS